MAFQYGEQKDINGNITHTGTWSTSSKPKEAIDQIIEDLRALKDDQIALPGTHTHTMRVKVATTENLPILSNPLAIDGVQTIAGDLVLVKDQTDAKQNGVYVVMTTEWQRVNALPLINCVDNGTVNKGLIYFLITPDPVIDTSELIYENVFGWQLGSGFSIVNDKVELSNSGVTPGTYRSVTVDSKGRVTTGTNPSTVSESGIVDAETVSGSQAKANTAEANAKAYADTKKTEANAYTDTKVADLVASSPDALNTLNELAQALGDDPNFATTVNGSISNKLNKDGSEAMTGDLKLANTNPTDNLHATAKGYVDKKSLMMAIIFGG